METIKDLTGFPFRSFAEMKSAYEGRKFRLLVDRAAALRWINEVVKGNPHMRMHSFFMALPFLSVLGFLIFTISTGTWTMLWWLPVIAILFLIFHPSAMSMWGIIRPLLIFGVFASLLYSIVGGIGWLFALTLTLALIWYGENFAYSNAVKSIMQAVLNDERLFVEQWRLGHIGIQLNGKEALYYEAEEAVAEPAALAPYLSAEDLKRRRIAFIHCEDEEGCGFGLEFKYPNCTFFYCKQHRHAVNEDLSILDMKELASSEVLCEQYGKMERYNLLSEDNVCPYCRQNTLAILSVGV